MDYTQNQLTAALAIAALLTGLAAGYAAFDQSEKVDSLQTQLETANSTIDTLEERVVELKEELEEKPETVTETVEVEVVPEGYHNVSKAVETPGSYALDYFPNAERTVEYEVTVNEEIEDGKTKDVAIVHDYEYDVVNSLEESAVYDGEEGTIREDVKTDVTDVGDSRKYVFKADDEGTYYVEVEYELADGVSDDVDDEEIVDTGVDISIEPEKDYYVK